MGETVGGNIPNYYVWVFSESKGWPGDEMVKDDTNTGWYYVQIAPGKTAANSQDGSTKTIRPGETLMIFNSAPNADTGQHRHRCSHHLDPGIQLFDYEDREGWVLYDPLCAPYYRVYDVRPEIVNATYDVYTQKPLKSWSIKYGVYNYANNVATPYSINCNNLSSYTVETIDGVTMYHYTSVFKAPAGDLAKSIVYYFEDGTSTTIFGGENFATSDDTARGYCYLIDNKWTWSRTPMHVEPPAMRRVYLKNFENWPTPYMHYWVQENNNDGTTWPGVAMKRLEPDSQWWYLDIELKYNMIIFSNNGSNQSADTSIGSGTEPTYRNNEGGVIDDRP